MQTRRAGVNPLEIVLPRPALPRRRSSLLSTSSAASPRTPRSCTGGSPASSFFFAPSVTPNRKSIDSWNSSNIDLAEEKECEWKIEQTLLLSRTLEALPPHLITPFAGPLPPSNLLDKIARGISQAKGAAEWPHSLRATRFKLVELARQRAKEEKRSQENQHVIPEGSCPSYAVGDALPNVRAQSKRPLYRQSSMDFMNVPGKSDIKDNDNINRLSNRLQRTNRIINPSYHPYSRDCDSSLGSSQTIPSNPSSSTLSSFSWTNDSLSSRQGMLRRSASTLTTVSNSSSLSSMSVDEHSYMLHGSLAPDLRVQRVRKSESFCGVPPTPNRSFKRAPSFGVRVTESPSSDEEEKLRSHGAKKLRTRASHGSLSPNLIDAASPASVARTPSSASNQKPQTVKAFVEASPTLAVKKTVRPRANLERNPSIFGAELPHLKQPSSPSSLASTPELVSSSPKAKPKTLRRVRRLVSGRKLSFGISAAGNEADGEQDPEDTNGMLGRAFQLA